MLLSFQPKILGSSGLGGRCLGLFIYSRLLWLPLVRSKMYPTVSVELDQVAGQAVLMGRIASPNLLTPGDIRGFAGTVLDPSVLGRVQ